MPELFDKIGQKAEQLVDKVKPASNETSDAAPAAEDDERIVEEIESLCMNCHENVSHLGRSPGHSIDCSC